MKLSRRIAALAAAALSAGVLVSSGPVQAATGYIDYECTITGEYKYTFAFNQDTNIPTKIYAGKARVFTYTATTDFPEPGVATARFFGVTSFDGAIDATVLVNGKPVQVHAPIPKTNVPSNTNQLTLSASGPITIPAQAVGAVVLKPSNIKFTVRAYKADNSTLFTLNKGNCTMAPNTKTMDTSAAVKSPSATTASLAYAKATKRATSTAVVKATSGAVPTGTVTMTLFKGTTKVTAKTIALTNGKAVGVFTGVKAKGTYKVVSKYNGSATVNPAAPVTKSFVIR